MPYADASQPPRPIEEFRGPYRWLSNFALIVVRLDGRTYPSVEHAYQAAKTTNVDMRRRIADCPTTGAAKRLGRIVLLRPGWDQMKIDVMRKLLEQKFADPFYRDLLLATDDRQLIEGNHWGDTFWGVCRGVGENHLGRLIMEVRDGIRQQLGGTA